MTARTLGFISLFLIFASAPAWARDVEFSWTPVPNALKYQIQISATDDFTKSLADSQVEKPAYTAQLPIGHYFYRVRVIDLKNRPGLWSKEAAVNVNPYAPELLEPKNEFETDYFEIHPTIDFSWKPVEGKPEYEIIIFRSTGQKMLEARTDKTEFSTNKIGEGEYLWKVRTVAQKIYVSDYCDPRHFTVVKKPLMKPELVKPADGGVAPAYRSVYFEWKQDPNTHFTDLYLEKVTGIEGAKPFKAKVTNYTGTSWTADYEEPGQYKWSVTTKEGKETPGVTSDIADFEIRNDMISKYNYELEFSLSPVNDFYTTSSSRQTTDGSFISQNSVAQGMFTGFLGGFYVFEPLGIFISTRSARLGIESINGFEQETDLSLRVRFGTKGFSQEFIYGWRIMDIVEAEAGPTQTGTDFTTSGPLLGTRVTGTIKDNWKAQLNFFYYKPLQDMEGIGSWTADVYGGSLGVKWNFMYQFWLGYRFALERINGSFTTPGQSSTYNATWTQYRTEPFFLSISFEH